jgi:BMFP domain-containing protein YqiC
MQSDSILDQLSKLMTNAAGAAKGVRDEIGTMIKTQAERLVNDLDLVPREEFNVVKAMLRSSQREVATLAARLEKLEHGAVKNDSRDSRLFKTPMHASIRKRSPKGNRRR